MPAIEVDAISLMISLLEKAKSLYENESCGIVDLEAVVEYELLTMADIGSQANNEPARTFLRALGSSRDIMCQMLDGIDSLLNTRPYAYYPDNPIINTLNSLPSASVNFCSLPTEIIANIFEQAVYSGRHWPNSYIIYISSINRRCREIALKTPTLWTYLSSWQKTNLMRLSVERSQSRGLDVVVFGLQREKFDQFFSILKDNYHRITSLEFVDSQCFTFFQEAFAGATLPRLLKLIVGSCEEAYNPLILPDSLMSNLENYDGPWFAPNADALWTTKLTQCTLRFSCFDHTLLAGGQFYLPNCESLILKFSERRDNNSVWLPSVVEEGSSRSSSLANLRHLEVHLDEVFHLNVLTHLLLNCIPTRQLWSLKIILHYKVFHNSGMHDYLFSFPLENLKSLGIYYDNTTQGSILCDPKVLPSLEHLEISGTIGVPTSVFLRDSKSLTTLKNITFDRCHRFPEKNLLDLQRKLMNPNRPQKFERLQLNQCDIQQTVLSRLKYKMPGKIYWEQND